MGANQQYTRIDTMELKSLLCQKIGQQRAEKYFHLLNKLLNLQLSKSNFDRLCIRTIGRENLSLHNRLISSIVKNAAFAKVPPPMARKLANSLNVKVSKLPQSRNSLQSLYGDAFPLSPRKSRSPRDRKFKDRPSPLGPYGKINQTQSPTELHSLGSRPPVEVFSVEDGEEVGSGSPGIQSRSPVVQIRSPVIQSRSPVTAPIGVSFWDTRTVRKTYNRALEASLRWQRCENIFELHDTTSLKGYLRQKLEGEGVSVSEECANLLNTGLDGYLKRVIENCTMNARSRSSQSQSQNQTPSISMVSVSDFGLTIHSDPHMLGNKYPRVLEKLRCELLRE